MPSVDFRSLLGSHLAGLLIFTDLTLLICIHNTWHWFHTFVFAYDWFQFREGVSRRVSQITIDNFLESHIHSNQSSSTWLTHYYHGTLYNYKVRITGWRYAQISTKRKKHMLVDGYYTASFWNDSQPNSICYKDLKVIHPNSGCSQDLK